MPSLTRLIQKKNPLHGQILAQLSARIKLAQKSQQTRHPAWQKAEDTILAYIPESDLDAARRRDREDNGTPRYTTIKLPYTYALVMALHTYLTSVFFGRSPVHQFSGRHGEGEQQVQALEALIAYQVEIGEMMGPYYLWFYDAVKYGVGVIEEYWDKEMTQFSTLNIQQDPTTGQAVKMQTQIRMPGYEGSRVCNISPWNFLPDPRVAVGNFQQGEFVFVRKHVSWNTIVRRAAQGYYMNLEALTGQIKDFAGGTISNSTLELPDFTVTPESEGSPQPTHPASLPIYEGCVEIIPKEWGLGDSNYPEKWMFTVTGDLSTIIGVQPHGAMHCKFPYGVIETEVEAYGAWNRGLPDIIEPVQNTMDWLINQHFFNVRAALNNQFIIDPSKIVAEDAEDGGPGFVYRLRPEAYGSDVRSFFYQIPVQDMTRGHVGDMNTMLGIGERITGISDQILGAITGSGRKTATEVRTSTGFGVNRQKTVAEYISATGFAQHAQRIVQMSQQYYSGEKKFKIAGSLLREMGMQDQNNFINVTPEQIKGFYDVVPVDGTLPVDRLALANLWKELLLQMRNVPGLIQQYDLGKIFTHIGQLAGIRNLNQFKIEVNSPQSLLQQADAGNIVPIKPGAGGGPGANPMNVPKIGGPTI